MTAVAAPPQTASTMSALLRGHHFAPNKPPAGVLAEEIESPDGRRRADAIWAPFGRGMGLHGYEVKCSRTDVITELNDPMKCEPWRQYCVKWWLFVADPAFVDGLTIPAEWGILAPPSGRRTRTLTVVQEAPKLNPMDTGPAWHRVMSVNAQRVERAVYSAEQQVRFREEDIARLREQLANGVARHDPAIAKLREIKNRIEAEMRAPDLHVYLSEADVADAIVAAVVDQAKVRAWCLDQLNTVTRLQAAIALIQSEARERSWRANLDSDIAALRLALGANK